MRLENVKIGFCLTGSFCTITKIFTIMKNLVAEGANITPIISSIVDKLDTKFIAANDTKNFLKDITGNEIINTISKAEPIGPNKLFDIVVVAPCTGNTIAKLANGITDTPVTMAVKAHLRNNRPVVIGISTNDGLGSSAKNLGMLLNTRNYYFVPFGQDDPLNKERSLVLHENMLVDTVCFALQGKQIQPLLVS